MKEFDYITIGGGSGGIASARRAAAHGAKVALLEPRRLGGTCVNVGCVPKKLMYNAASLREAIKDSAGYGFTVDKPKFDWAGVKNRRDAAVSRLVGIYGTNLEKAGVTHIEGRAKLRPGEGGDRHCVEVNGERLLARHVLIATGGTPRVPQLSGAQLGITSNGFFELEAQPKHVAIVGSGYVGVELAGIFAALGTKVTLFSRQSMPLSHFDVMLQDELLAHMTSAGIEFLEKSEPERVARGDNGLLKVTCLNRMEHAGYDLLLWAVGRVPSSAGLGLEQMGVDLDDRGHVVVDRFQNTTQQGIYAVGDVTGKVPLTPVAIAAGRLLADRLFAGQEDAALDYDGIPSVVFSRPPIGTVGLTERAARKSYGEDVAVHRSRFTSLFYAMTAHHPKTTLKLVTQASTGKVLGVHAIGRGVDEMIQGFAVAMRMGATKADFDRTVAIHPTGAEEFVTMK